MKKLCKQSGKRAVAMLLALAMVLSFAQTGLAVTAHAAQNSQSASAGALVANAYGAELKEWEKSILRSGYLKGNTYTYQAPSENNSDGLVSVDADSKTVTVKSYRDAQGNSWTCGETARIVADGQTVEEVPLSGGKGTFVYSDYGVNTLTDSNGVHYQITGRQSSWNMGLGKVMLILAAVLVGSFVLIGIVMTTLNRRAQKKMRTQNRNRT